MHQLSTYCMLVCLRQSIRIAPLATSNRQVSRIISKASNTLIILPTTQFLLHQINPHTLHDQDLIKLWVWEVDEVVPITCLLSNLWELLLRCLLCHAMLVDGDWVSEIHDRCEFVKLMVYLRWQLKHTSGWIEVPGYSCWGTQQKFKIFPTNHQDFLIVSKASNTLIISLYYPVLCIRSVLKQFA